METPAARFAAALKGLDKARMATLMEAVLDSLDWTDAYDQPAEEPPGALLFASTFGETVHEAIAVTVGRYELRYPAPSQQRASGLHLVDVERGFQAGIADLGEVLAALDADDAEEVARKLGLAAAAADQPGGRFKWAGGRLSQAYEVVAEVHRWPGQIQLEAARRYDPDSAIGDEIWIDGRELLPVCWVLDWLRSA